MLRLIGPIFEIFTIRKKRSNIISLDWDVKLRTKRNLAVEDDISMAITAHEEHNNLTSTDIEIARQMKQGSAYAANYMPELEVKTGYSVYGGYGGYGTCCQKYESLLTILSLLALGLLFLYLLAVLYTTTVAGRKKREIYSDYDDIGNRYIQN